MPAVLSRFLRDEYGSMLPVLAGFLAAGMGFGALVIDLGRAYVLKERLQVIADAASYAAVLDLPDTAAARDSALRVAEVNAQGGYFKTIFPDGGGGDPDLAAANELIGSGIAFGTWDDSTKTFDPSGSDVNAVQVTARLADEAVPTLFAGLFGGTVLGPEASAVSVLQSSPPCLLLLGTMTKALELSGGSDIEMPDCVLQVNSPDAIAVRVGGGHVYTERLCVVGGVSLSGGATTDPAPEPSCAPAPDPLAGMTPPAYGACDYVNVTIGGGTHTFTPGVYCGGIEMTGGVVATFEPGVYVIKDGELKSGGGGSITGNGVAFHFTGTGARSEVSGGGTVHLTAPTSGPLKGFVFYQDPTVDPDLTHKLSGGGDMYFEGTLYLPDHHVEWSGGSAGGVPPWTVFIAKSFLISGNGLLKLGGDFTSSPVPTPQGMGNGRGPRLVR